MLPPVASRFVAGETAAEAIERAQRLNDRGVGAILNRLGEHYEDRADADADTAAYRDLVDDIESAGVRACISAKPSQLGLDVSEAVFRENAAEVVSHAVAKDVFVWFDMEDHTTTDATLAAYEALAREHGGGVGVCVQANLERTPEDLHRLADVPGKVRLVKGAYDEPAAIAHTDSAAVNAAYEDCLETMFRTFDGGVAVGSHDPTMLDRAAELHAEYGTDYEVQMLMGVRESAQYDLAETVDVWQYVPYGGKWLAYFWRRVAERRENLAFALRAILSG
ncbi:MAG: proline dehydrogenase family protein [Halobacteriaceae archaeon]